MLWRETHVTQTLQPDVVRPLIGQSLVGGRAWVVHDGLWVMGVGPESFSDVEIWHRLVQERFGEPEWASWGFVHASSEIVEDLIPPSRAPRTWLWQVSDPDWTAPYLGRAVAVCWRAGIVLAQAGRPTEEAWDAMQLALEFLLSETS